MPEKKTNSKIFNTCFFLFILFLSVYHFDYWSNGNTNSRVIFVKSVVEDQTIYVDKYQEQSMDVAYVNGHYYSDKAPFPACATMPFYYLLSKAGFDNTNNRLIYSIGNFISGSLPFALIVFITFLFIQKIKPDPSAVFYCTLPYFGSFIFIYSGTFFAHVLSSLFILTAYIALTLKENYFLSGLLTGLAVCSEYPLVVIAFIWLLQIIFITKKWKVIIQFIAGGLPFALLLLFNNYLTTGHAFDSLYYHQVNFQRTGLFSSFIGSEGILHSLELLAGVYRGALFYAPALILLIYILFKYRKNPLLKFSTSFLWLPSILYFLSISFNDSWYGGWCYGPRYLSAVAALFLFEGIMQLPTSLSKKSVYFLSFIGIAFSFMAKSTLVYSLPTDQKNPMMDLIIPEFFKGHFNENNMLTNCFHLSNATGQLLWLPILLAGLFLFYKWGKRSTTL